MLRKLLQPGEPTPVWASLGGRAPPDLCRRAVLGDEPSSADAGTVVPAAVAKLAWPHRPWAARRFQIRVALGSGGRTRPIAPSHR